MKKAGEPAFFIDHIWQNCIAKQNDSIATIAKLNYTKLMDKRQIIIGLSLLVSSAVACADIYKCADETGQVAFADAKTKSGYSSCKLVLRDESNPVQAPVGSRPSGMRVAGYTKSAPPTDFPKVDRQTQTQRDDKRKQILLSELESEQKALQDAKMQHLLADLDSHEKNIGLLQKELSAFR